MNITINVADIKAGDEFNVDGNGWAALEDAEILGSTGEVSVRVQYAPDGGIGDRIWPNVNRTVTVSRVAEV